MKYYNEFTSGVNINLLQVRGMTSPYHLKRISERISNVNIWEKAFEESYNTIHSVMVNGSHIEEFVSEIASQKTELLAEFTELINFKELAKELEFYFRSFNEVLATTEYNKSLKDIELETRKESIKHQSEELHKDFLNSIATNIGKEENWQQKFYNFYDNLKKKYPIYALIFVLLLSYIFNKGLDILVEAKIPVIVREKPNSESTMITRLEERQQVYILDDERYYYEIEIEDTSNSDGEPIRGWVSKRSMKIIELNEITAVEEN
jgi:hypothetical protein